MSQVKYESMETFIIYNIRLMCYTTLTSVLYR